MFQCTDVGINIIEYCKVSTRKSIRLVSKLLNKMENDSKNYNVYKYNPKVPKRYYKQLILYGDSNLTEIPEHITHIVNYNGKQKLHDKIVTLSFDDNFNGPIELPKGIKRIEFGRNYNYPITIPSSVHTISIYHPLLDNVSLSPNVTNMTVLRILSQESHIDLSSEKYQYVRKLRLGMCVSVVGLPQNLIELKFSDISIIRKDQKTTSGLCPNLPSSLRRLILPYDFNIKFNLPKKLERIKFGSRYNQTTIFPDTIEYIELGVSFTKCLIVPTMDVRIISMNTQFETRLKKRKRL